MVKYNTDHLSLMGSTDLTPVQSLRVLLTPGVSVISEKRLDYHALMTFVRLAADLLKGKTRRNPIEG